MGGASQNWTLSSHFFAFFYSLSVSTTLELALKSFLPHPFSVTSVFRIYFLLPLPMHISDFRPSSSHTKILAVARQALLDAVSFLMFTSSLSPHSKDLSTITISYLINLSYIFFPNCAFALLPQTHLAVPVSFPSSMMFPPSICQSIYSHFFKSPIHYLSQSPKELYFL